MTQASSSFKRLDTRAFTYATSTLITQVIRLVTRVQLLLTHCYSELTPYAALANSCLVSVYYAYQCQGHAH